MPPKLADAVKHLHLLVPIALIKRIDDWRGRQDGVPNFSEAVRRLIEAGLEATSKKAGKHR